MAEAILRVVCMNLNSLIQDEFGLLWGVDKEMRKLSSMLSTIRAVLSDAEEKQLKDREIQDWLLKLKDTAYDVDDILDVCTTEASKSRILSRFRPANILFRHSIGKRLKKIRDRLDEIAGERTKFHLEERGVERQVEARERRETGSILTQSQVYGRDEDKERIVEFLVKHAINYEDVSVYPVIGMGGLGKTTLAQLVFNDERVNGHFEISIWVCISEDFDLKRVIRAIIRSASGDANCEALELEPLQGRLRELLNKRRYLLVLDDIWNEDQEKWDRLKHVLACGSKGTSIIITTRVEKVALIMGTLPPHRLSSLSEDDCWSLFRQCAFQNESEERPNLVAIGREIVRKCRGIPLAAKALGGLMRFKRGENEWLFIQESEIWNLPQCENSILAALRLSYYNLPLELRRCFSYCAIFPKDSEIEKENLIDLWMATGFISSNGKLELEDIGNEIWNELYWRSFFQDVKEDEFGNIISFKMHDLMHDLAQSMVLDECCIVEAEKSTNISKRIRHVSLVANSEKLVTIPKALYEVESLQTLLPQPMQFWRLSTSFVSSSKFSFLRVFVARGTAITGLSSSIGKLKHLRYLYISSTKIKMLPESICSLWNLQTLKIEKCWHLQGLPKQMRHLRNLRHLYMDGWSSITQMPPKIGQLTCLKMLSFFIVGEKRGFHLGELQGLNLRGKLEIKHLERVKNPKDAKDANLIRKQNLRSLYLSWESNGESKLQEDAEQVLEALEPHPNLEQLSIFGFMGTHFPLWMRNPILKNVVHIELSNCENCLELPPFGKIPSLRTLHVYKMKLEYIDNESYSGAVRKFPSLETLYLHDLPTLKRLSREEGGELLPRLAKLQISSCPKLTLPRLSFVKELEVWRCNEDLLSSISNLRGLTSLEVFGPNNEATSFPDGFLRNLACLQTLRIDSFTKLKVLPTELVSLTALKSLLIVGCHELECLPGQGQGLAGLASLQLLEIYNCQKLKSLPEGLQNLTRGVGC